MADFAQRNGKSIAEAFIEFDETHPEVYLAIERQALLAVGRGRKKFSIKAIVNWIRWNVFIETEDRNSAYRINDAYISHYARKFIGLHPDMEEYIELRKLRASTGKSGDERIEPHDGMLF